MVLYGSKKQQADLDSTSLKLELRKVDECGKNCWFKVMPRFKVRLNGEEVSYLIEMFLNYFRFGQGISYVFCTSNLDYLSTLATSSMRILDLKKFA